MSRTSSASSCTTLATALGVGLEMMLAANPCMINSVALILQGSISMTSKDMSISDNNPGEILLGEGAFPFDCDYGWLPVCIASQCILYPKMASSTACYGTLPHQAGMVLQILAHVRRLGDVVY